MNKQHLQHRANLNIYTDFLNLTKGMAVLKWTKKILANTYQLKSDTNLFNVSPFFTYHGKPRMHTSWGCINRFCELVHYVQDVEMYVHTSVLKRRHFVHRLG